MSAASFLRSSFLQAINAVMLCPAHDEKVPQASGHLCLVKVQIRSDISCVCQPEPETLVCKHKCYWEDEGVRAGGGCL